MKGNKSDLNYIYIYIHVYEIALTLITLILDLSSEQSNFFVKFIKEDKFVKVKMWLTPC